MQADYFQPYRHSASTDTSPEGGLHLICIRRDNLHADVAGAVRNAKAGQVRYRAEKGGIVHGGIGKISFDAVAIKENLEALLIDLKKSKPSTAKGIYLKKVALSSTMGPGLVIDQSSLTV